MKFTTALFTLLLSACSASTEDKRAELESLKREALAGLVRQQGECKAVALEFQGDRLLVENCLATYRAMAEMAQKTISDIEKRLAQLDSEGR